MIAVVRLQPAAEADAAAAAGWYEGERGGLGVRFVAELDAALQRVARNPLGYECITEDVRRALLRRFPYAVYFSYDGTIIEIFAILHQHRSDDAWRARR